MKERGRKWGGKNRGTMEGNGQEGGRDGGEKEICF